MLPPRPILRLGWAIHRTLFRLSGGRLGTGRPAAAGTLGTLFLLTRGRTTGRVRRNGLFYLDDGRNLVVVASNAGAEHDPAWWHNLQATPKAAVEIGVTTLSVVGRAATPEERARLWPIIVTASSQYRVYETATSRPIPVVILEPADPGPGG